MCLINFFCGKRRRKFFAYFQICDEFYCHKDDCGLYERRREIALPFIVAGGRTFVFATNVCTFKLGNLAFSTGDFNLVYLHLFSIFHLKKVCGAISLSQRFVAFLFGIVRCVQDLFWHKKFVFA